MDEIVEVIRLLRAMGKTPPQRYYANIIRDDVKAAGMTLAYPAGKTYSFYRDKLREYVRELYRHEISDIEWLDLMMALIDDQLTGAWNAGMRDAGLDPRVDMDEEMLDELAGIIQNEYDRLIDFAAAILQGADAETGFGPLYARADMWADRWNDVKNRAILFCSPDAQRYMWVYGDTQHCSTCTELNGTVATAYAWEQSGIHPQSPPNEELECGGWRCQCRLEPTKRRSSRGTIPGTDVPCKLRP